jgi:phosphatidylglycerophosphatase A
MQWMIVLLVIVGVGWWAAGRAERLLGGRDPGAVVIDEVAGMVLSVAGLPRSVAPFVAAFLVFRIFDIAKPFPMRHAELLSGGLGVMLDDLIAGVYTLAILWGLLAVLRIPA